MYRPALISGVLLAALAVILGAFGAHSLKPLLTAEQLNIFEKGAQYQFYHAFALIATGIIYSAFPVKQVRIATTFFLLGVILFSGSLYALTILKMQGEVGLGGVGILTPIGGTCFIIGWILLLIAVMKKRTS